MDPDLALSCLKAGFNDLTTAIDAGQDLNELADELSLMCDYWNALSGWLENGGYKPTVWQC